MIAPTPLYQSSDVLPALRELFSQHPGSMSSGPEMLARMLYVFCYLPYQPETFEVEAAMKALELEDGMVA